MKNFIKRTLLYMISLSLFLMSIDTMYLKVYASEPIVEVMNESDSEIIEEAEKVSNPANSNDTFVNLVILKKKR